MVKVSIIVPVHNAQEYLDKCVKSLLAQTLTEIEIILVDDASADDSRSIIRHWAGQFPEKIVPVYLDENIRQGGARNRGMGIAAGEYIAFVDADDFIEPEMCRVLYDAARGADLCGADYYIDTGESLKTLATDYGEGFAMTPERKSRFIGHCGYFWSRIYKRAFLEEFALRFPEGVFYEDAYFNFMTALYARSAVKAEGTFYHYYQSPNSTIRNPNDPRRFERIAIPSRIIGDCRARGVYETNKALVDYKYITMQMSSIVYTCLEQPGGADISQLARIRKAVKAECPDFARCPYYADSPFRLRCYLRLTLLHPKIARWAYKADRLIEMLGVLHAKWKGRK